MTPADRIRAAITRCYEESPVPPTADDFSAAVCEALADHLGSCNASTELQRIATDLRGGAR